jgi:hypothetical protein
MVFLEEYREAFFQKMSSVVGQIQNSTDTIPLYVRTVCTIFTTIFFNAMGDARKKEEKCVRVAEHRTLRVSIR